MKNPSFKTSSLVLGLLFSLVAPELSYPPMDEDSRERHYGRVTINVVRGVRLSLDNRTTGRITVNGWDRDVIEAHAVSTRGDEVVVVERSEGPDGKEFFLKADYADLSQPGAPTSHVSTPPEVDGNSLQVHLELNVPRHAEIELIQVRRSDVQVTGLDTAISVSGRQSSVILKQVGGAEVQTLSGNVEIDGVSGLASVATVSGAIRVSNSRNAVRAVSIAGPIEIKCSVGRIDVSNTEAPIELINIDGDVDAVATNSSVRFTGNLRDGGRYYLKSMAGRVEMLLPTKPSGFSATLSSYRGIVESDFNLDSKQPASHAQNRRRVGRFGDGKAQVTLDSFEGLVRLTKLDATAIPGCK